MENLKKEGIEKITLEQEENLPFAIFLSSKEKQKEDYKKIFTDIISERIQANFK